MSIPTRPPLGNSNPRPRHRRQNIAQLRSDFEQVRGSTSRRAFARERNVPESTQRYWPERAGRIPAPPEVVEFFESPAGLEVMHRLVLALQQVLTQEVQAGSRYVCRVLVLSGLSLFVASSHGVQEQTTDTLTKLIIDFEPPERARLAGLMTPRHITLSPDENFHEGCCLLSMALPSGFIVAEKKSLKRDAPAWKEAINEGLQGLPVTIIQQVHDQAKALQTHTRSLRANYSPDLFHLQHLLFGYTARPLLAKVKSTRAALEAAEQQLAYRIRRAPELKTQLGAHANEKLAAWIAAAQRSQDQAQAALEQAEAHRQRSNTAVRELAAVYHPFDLNTGAKRSAEQVREDIEQRFALVRQVALDAGLSESSVMGIESAKDPVPAMVATIDFVHTTIQTRMEPLALPESAHRAVLSHWIPALYLEEVAARAATADDRHALNERAEELLAPLLEPYGPLSALTDAQCQAVATVAEECAQLFQRSSSATEGRNGQRSLAHHHLHHRSEKRQKARTIVENYFLQRPDRTTAAERFFGHPPQDLFAYLVEHMPYPARPARLRPRPEPGRFKPRPSLVPAPGSTPSAPGPPDAITC